MANRINSEVLKEEFFLSVDDFGNISTYSNLASFARLIQRLIVMQPRSYPDDPEMGVGIENYQFDFLDRTTLSEISFKITEQVNTYLPNNNIDSIIVDKVDIDNRNNTIGVLINLFNPIDGKNNLILTFDKVGKSGKIDSKIYI